jgi:hypothetical protein
MGIYPCPGRLVCTTGSSCYLPNSLRESAICQQFDKVGKYHFPRKQPHCCLLMRGKHGTFHPCKPKCLPDILIQIDLSAATDMSPINTHNLPSLSFFWISTAHWACWSAAPWQRAARVVRVVLRRVVVVVHVAVCSRSATASSSSASALRSSRALEWWSVAESTVTLYRFHASSVSTPLFHSSKVLLIEYGKSWWQAAQVSSKSEGVAGGERHGGHGRLATWFDINTKTPLEKSRYCFSIDRLRVIHSWLFGPLMVQCIMDAV